MSMFNKITKSFQWGDKTVVMETGEIARQATGAVLVDIDGTVILATVAASKSAKPGQDFFPLTVDYIEKTYAAGKIPGSFFKREAKPSELEILTCRLIDRPLRPAFVKGLRNEVQVVVTVLSAEPQGHLRRAGDQRRVGVHPDRRAAVLRSRRRRARRADQRPVGGVPDGRAAGDRRVRHGGRRSGGR